MAYVTNTNRKKKKEKKEGLDKIVVFMFIYIIAIAWLVVSGLLSYSFFAYEAFNSLPVLIIDRAVLILLLLAAMLHSILDADFFAEKIVAAVVFGSTAVVFTICFFDFPAQVETTLLFLNSIATFLVAIIYYLARYNDNTQASMSKKIMFCAFFGFLFVMFGMLDYTYIRDTIMAWAFIPAAIIFVLCTIITFTVYKGLFFREINKKKWKKANAVLVLILIFIASYFVSWMGMATINYSFSPPPVLQPYEIIEKDISRSGETTQFECTIHADGTEHDIPVPAYVYHSLEVGDYLSVNYYSGALGFPFFVYEG